MSLQIIQPKVTCHLCCKQVDEIIRTYDVLSCHQIYTAYCHGHVEIVRLPDILISQATNIELNGVAFAPKDKFIASQTGL